MAEDKNTHFGGGSFCFLKSSGMIYKKLRYMLYFLGMEDSGTLLLPNNKGGKPK